MKQSGFTLIELSIVLVIIGLTVGGVLVGRDLITASEVRAQVSQIEKYRTASNTFRLKYGYLPGDIPDPAANSFGFKARGVYPGGGDGNGVIQGTSNGAGGSEGGAVVNGESALFWVDLSSANLIDSGLSTATFASWNLTLNNTQIDAYLPKAAIGHNNSVYIYSGQNTFSYTNVGDSINLYAISIPWSASGWTFNSNPGLSVMEAYNIDIKMDDGYPQSGKVIAQYVNFSLRDYYPAWAGGSNTLGAGGGGWPNTPTTAATVGTANTCYDNSASAGGTPGVAGAQQHYSTEMNSGTAMNCALSFRF